MAPIGANQGKSKKAKLHYIASITPFIFYSQSVFGAVFLRSPKLTLTWCVGVSKSVMLKLSESVDDNLGKKITIVINHTVHFMVTTST